MNNMTSELKNLARAPRSTSSSSTFTLPSKSPDAYDTLDRFNARTCSVESGFGSANDGYEVFDDEASYEINDTYTPLNDLSAQPDLTLLPRPFNSDTYEDFKSYSKQNTVPEKTRVGRTQKSPELDQIAHLHREDRVYSLPDIHTPMTGFKTRDLPVPLNHALVPEKKKRNLLYESSITTQTSHHNKRVNGTKISITKQNSSTTHTTRKQRRRICCGVAQTHCYLGLNVVFGTCAIVALIIGVVLIFHQQENVQAATYRKGNEKVPATDTATAQKMVDIMTKMLTQVNNVDKTVGTFNDTLKKLIQQVSANKDKPSLLLNSTYKQCVYSENSREKYINGNVPRNNVLEVDALPQVNRTIHGSLCEGTSSSMQLIKIQDDHYRCKCVGLVNNFKQHQPSNSLPTMKCKIKYWSCPTNN